MVDRVRTGVHGGQGEDRREGDCCEGSQSYIRAKWACVNFILAGHPLKLLKHAYCDLMNFDPHL